MEKVYCIISDPLEFSLNGVELSLNSVNSGKSENLRNHWSMNWVQCKDLLCYLWLCGLVVSFLSLTQEILGSSPTLLIFLFLKIFCHWIQRIQWKHLEKTPLNGSHVQTMDKNIKLQSKWLIQLLLGDHAKCRSLSVTSLLYVDITYILMRSNQGKLRLSSVCKSFALNSQKRMPLGSFNITSNLPWSIRQLRFVC